MRKKFELSHPQKRILFTQFLYEKKPLFNIGGFVVFSGNISFTRLQYALKEAVQRLDCFGIRICRSGKEYIQYFVDDESVIEEYFLNEQDDWENIIYEKTKRVINTNFDVFDKPLYKIIAFSINNDLAGYILCCHHLIFDGWSVSIFAEMVSDIYNDGKKKVGEYKNFLVNEREYFKTKRAIVDEKYWADFLQSQTSILKRREKEYCCNSFREEFIIDNLTKKQLIEHGEKWKSVSTVLCACFILADYVRNGNAIIAMSNYNRHGREMRRTAGMFTNTLLVKVPFFNGMTLAELLRMTRNEMNKSLYHYQWPYNLLGIKNDEQIFHYNVNCYNTHLNYSLGAAIGKYREVYSDMQDIPVQIVLNSWDDEWKLCIDMREDYYHVGDGSAILQYIIDFVEELATNPEQLINDFLGKLRKRELDRQKQILVEEVVNDITLSERIDRVLKPAFPDAQSVLYENNELTCENVAELIYGAMDIYEKSGIIVGDKILLFMDNNLQYVIYLLAAVASGICFIPLDISTPIEQIKYIYKNATAKAIVSKESILPDMTFEVIYPKLVKGKRKNINYLSEDLDAYLLYTSGTSGSPKGVLISRRALSTYLNWAEDVYGSATFFLYSSPAFDLSLTTLLLPLTSNGKLVVFNETSSALYKLSKHEKVEMVNAIKATPSNLALLLQQNSQRIHLDMIICGGEELTVNLAQKLQKHFGDNCKIYNEYGPTECTIGCACHLFDKNKDKEKTVPIGKATPGSHIYIVDSKERLCSVGKAGEIYLSGKQLATMYWNMPEETTEYFRENVSWEKRIYRTGDLGRYLYDGTIEYLGRIGRQCKLNGYRIELDGIERVIKSLSGVTNAAVWVSDSNEKKLLAAVETTVYTEKQIQDYMAKMLPLYCIPNHIYICSSMPITQNGKVDFKYLLSTVRQNQKDNKMEILEKVLRETLNYNGEIERFNFVLDGGDSIRALHIIALLDEYNYSLSLIDLLEHSRFEEIANCMQYKQEVIKHEMNYVLPCHLKYFADTCMNFESYRHVLIIHYTNSMDKETANLLNRKLRMAFPSLNSCYENGYIYENEIIGPVKWDYFRNKDEQNYLLSQIYNNEKTPNLFGMHVISNEKESYIGFTAHHILVDGLAWRHIFQTTSDILNGNTVKKRGYMEIWRMDDNVNLKYSPFSWNDKNHHYQCIQKKYELINEINSMDFFDAVVKAMVCDDFWNDYLLLCDWNGRELIEINQTDNIGCYSLMLPLEPNKESLRSQFRNYYKTKEFDLAEVNSLRVNYLGDLNSTLPTDMVVIKESIEYSIQSCAGYGSMGEITGVVIDNEIVLYFSWRFEDIQHERIELLLDRIGKDLFKRKDNRLVLLTEEEEEELFK